MVYSPFGTPRIILATFSLRFRMMSRERGKHGLCCYANVISTKVIFVIVTDVINLAYLECRVLDADDAAC